MFFKKTKIQKILKTTDGERAVMAIYDVLQPLFNKRNESLTQYELDFCLIEALECEVNSGGFNSYFYNSYGDFAGETLSALERIGSVWVKAIFKEAISVFHDSVVPKGIDERIEIINAHEDEFDKLWDELDNKFYKYEENIHGLLLDYVKKNILEFR